jgi:hypothetical protein
MLNKQDSNRINSNCWPIDVESASVLGILKREYLVIKRLLKIHASEHSSEAVVRNEQRLEAPRQKRSRFEQFMGFAPGIWSRAHIGPGASEHRCKLAQRGHLDSAPKHSNHPLTIADVSQSRIEQRAFIRYQAASKKHRAA